MQTITKHATLVWQIPYVTNGLAAYWDGQWNASGGIHTTSATTWKDLLGTHDITLVPNSGLISWLDDGLKIEGDNPRISPPFPMSDFVGKGNSFTVSYLVNFEQINSGRRYVPISMNDYCFGFNWYGNDFFASLPWANGLVDIKYDSLVGHDMMYTVSTDGRTLQVGVNGKTAGTGICGDYSMTLAKKLRMFHVARPSTDEPPWICTIRRILIYSRPISAAEDAFNHEVDSIRFNH